MRFRLQCGWKRTTLTGDSIETTPRPMARDPRILDISLDEKSVVRRSPDVEHERAVAIFDLLEENTFDPKQCDHDGPYNLVLSIEDNRLIFDIRGADTNETITRVSRRSRRLVPAR